MADVLQKSGSQNQMTMQQNAQGMQAGKAQEGMQPSNPGAMSQASQPVSGGNKKKWFWIIGLVVLILVAVFGVWWFAFR